MENVGITKAVRESQGNVATAESKAIEKQAKIDQENVEIAQADADKALQIKLIKNAPNTPKTALQAAIRKANNARDRRRTAKTGYVNAAASKAKHERELATRKPLEKGEYDRLLGEAEDSRRIKLLTSARDSDSDQDSLQDLMSDTTKQFKVDMATASVDGVGGGDILMRTFRDVPAEQQRIRGARVQTFRDKIKDMGSIAGIKASYVNYDQYRISGYVDGPELDNARDNLASGMYTKVSEAVQAKLTAAPPDLPGAEVDIRDNRDIINDTTRVDALLQLVEDRRGKEAKEKSEAVTREVEDRLSLSNTTYSDRHSEVRAYITAEIGTGAIDVAQAQVLRERVTDAIDTAVNDAVARVRAELAANPAAVLDDAIDVQVLRVEGTSTPTDTEFKDKLIAELSGDRAGITAESEQNSEKVKAENTGKFVKQAVAGLVPGATVTDFNLPNPDGAGAFIEPIKHADLQAHIHKAEADGYIEDDAVSLSKIEGEQLDAMKQHYDQGIDDNTYASLNEAIDNIQERVADGDLNGRMQSELMAYAIKHYEDLVKQYKTTARPGIGETDWDLALENDGAIERAGQELVREANDENNPNYQRIAADIRAMIRVYDPKLFPSGLWHPTAMETYIIDNYHMTWAEEDAFLDPAGKLYILANEELHANDVIHNKLKGKADNLSEIETVIKDDIIGNLHSPPLSPGQLRIITNEMGRMKEDAKAVKGLASWEKKMGWFDAAGATAGTATLVFMLIALGVIATPVGPGGWLMIVGGAATAGFPTIARLQKRRIEAGRRGRDADQKADEATDNFILMAEELARMTVDLKDPEAMVKKVRDTQARIRSIEIKKKAA